MHLAAAVRPRSARRAALALAGLLAALPAARAEEGPDPHAHHRHDGRRARVSTAEVTVPPVTLTREDGRTVSLRDALDDGRPVVLNFIFTSCTTICPVLSTTFAQLQEKLGPERSKVQLVSISIDPEEDTPERLAAYARRFHAGAQWHHYTGTVEASVAVQRAFDAYRGDKMDHTPVTFLRAAPGRPWTRVDGFASSDELLRALHELVAAR
jgi:protein SCO1/2